LQPQRNRNSWISKLGVAALALPLFAACTSSSPGSNAQDPPPDQSQAGGGGTDSPPSTTPPTNPPVVTVPVDGCDMAAILSKKENACANSGCHGERPQGGVDFVSPGIEKRLVGVASTTSACSGRLLVDPVEPDSSLVLQVIDRARFAEADHCGVMMPFGTTTGVSSDDLSCFKQWVEKMASDVPSSGPPPVVFEPTTVESYTNKVKTLMTGSAVTDAELKAVTADPGALKGLAGGWLETPEFSTKMSAFLSGALQQRITGTLNTQLDGVQGPWNTTLIANIQDAFTRTALDVVDNHRPFTQVVTTRRWYATTATLVALAYLDNTATALRKEKHQILSAPTEGMPALPLPASYSVANHVWVFPSIPVDCVPGSVTLPNVLDMMLGGIHCAPGKNFSLAKDATVLTDADFNDWRLVDIGTATGAAPAPLFYDLDSLRGATKINLKLPRVGFFTSPAFLANWDTNDDNQFRVTASQTVITALGEIFSPADLTPTLRTDGLNDAHTAPGSTCYGCHQFLDPMRLYFGKALSTKYQAPEKPMTGTASFAFDGSSHDAGDLYTLADTLISHPHFADAWVQKLCYYANSQACDEKDPEFQRISAVFVASKYDFKAMAAELFASPLVTGAVETQTFKNEAYLVSITREQHLCQLLDKRLGQTGTCALAASFANLIPDDDFSRGSAVPVQPAVTSLFHFSAAEKLCDKVASKVVGTTATALFNPNQPDAALDSLTQNLMGLSPIHSRYATARAALADHLAQAKVGGATPTIALRSAFTLACLSPDVVALGL
jgi:hypothetical protein